MPPALLDHRLVVVLGKGGVGRTTIAHALGRLAAAQGLRTIVAEVRSADRERDGRASARRAATAERRVAEGLHHTAIDPELALEEYLHDQVPVPGMADLLGGSRTFTLLAAATPGMREMLTIGKVWELAQLDRRTRHAARYDLVVVDAPATGHGLALLRTPRTFAATARVGPIARQAGIIDRTLRDPAFTAFLAAATPAEAAVAEAVAVRDGVRRALDRELAAAVLNGVRPRRFEGEDLHALERALGTTTDRAARVGLRAALDEAGRVRAQRRHAQRLRNALAPTPVVPLPWRAAARLGPEDLDALGHRLARGLDEASRRARDRAAREDARA